MNLATTIALAAALAAGSTIAHGGTAAGPVLAQATSEAPETGLTGTVIPDVISPDPIAPGIDAPDLPETPSELGPGPEDDEAGAPAPPLPQDGGVEAAEAAEGDAVPPPSEAVMMAEEEVQAFIRGQIYQGLDAASGAVVATVSYGLDATSVLTLPDGTQEAGTYTFEGNSYCTRYQAFRDGTENCFTLESLGDGRAQAWYTDGRRALILAPVT